MSVASHRYGKTRVRVVRVVRSDDKHRVFDLSVQIMLSGNFEMAFTRADNTTTVPTDTVKNTVYVLAKKFPVDPIEVFGQAVTKHFLDMYPQVSRVECEISQFSWERAVINGQEHKHAFIKREPETRGTTVVQERGRQPSFTSRIIDLIVLKTTGSGFENFHHCEYTTLKDAKDRVFCTAVRAEWTYSRPPKCFNTTFASVRNIIIDVFANKYSASVQQEIYDTGKVVVEKHPEVQDIHFSLPNIHIFHYDINRFGLRNDDEVYVPFREPSGLIEAKISRARAAL